MRRAVSTLISARLTPRNTFRLSASQRLLSPLFCSSTPVTHLLAVQRPVRAMSSTATRSEQDEEDEDFDPEETLPPELKQLHIMPPTVTWGLLSVCVALIYFFGQTWADHIFVSDDDDGDDD